MHPYQDPQLPVADRVADLVSRMGLREKAAQCFIAMAFTGPLDQQPIRFPSEPKTWDLLGKGISHVNLVGSSDTPREMAEWANTAQERALSVSRLGIPLTIATDPRHAFTDNPALSLRAGPFSQWPESLGLAALANESRMVEFSEIARDEYLATGLRMALGPQVDLSTEPRWSRVSGTLGEDADLTGKLAAAQVSVFQGTTLGPKSVVACVKHFPGGGPAGRGYDSHFPWGAEQWYEGDSMAYHIKAFQPSFDAGCRFAMPAYGKPMGTKYEEVGFAFQKAVVTDLLRGECGFGGIVVSDWHIIVEKPEFIKTTGDFGYVKCWGLEHLSPQERIVRALDAGIDMFGGDSFVDMLVEVVESGKVPESRLDVSVARILATKFELGLFEQPYVDVEAAGRIVGTEEKMAAGLRAQKDSLTLLTNSQSTLPLQSSARVYAEGFLSSDAFAHVAKSVEDADVAVVKTATAYEVVGEGPMAARFHHGRLGFSAEFIQHVADLAKHCPVVLVVTADRPPVLAGVVDHASSIMISYGIKESALAEVLYGQSSPKGKLPFDLPRSDEAVEKSRTDVAYDTEDPLFSFGHGLTY